MFKVFVAALLLAGVNAFSPQAAFPLRRSPAQMGVRSFVRRMTGRTAVTASYSPSTVAEAWDNHFTAFGAQDLDKIMLDYTEESVLKCFDSTTEKLDVFTGTAEIRGFFDGLFKQLSDLSTLAAPVVDATEGPMKQVYLIWSCPGSGVKFAHDSFYYNDKFQITRQNIGYTSC